jgi:hypothetical protein
MRKCQPCRWRMIKCDPGFTGIRPCSKCTLKNIHCVLPTRGNYQDYTKKDSVADSEKPVEYKVSRTQPQSRQELIISTRCEPWALPPVSNEETTGLDGSSIDELLQEVEAVEAFVQAHYNHSIVDSWEFGEQTPTILQRVDRLLTFLQYHQSNVSAAKAKAAIYRIIHRYRTQFLIMLPLSSWDRSHPVEDKGNNSVEESRTVPSLRARAFPSELQIADASESVTFQQSAVEAQKIEAMNNEYAEGSKKGGRPPKKWPHPARRLLVRFVAAAFPNLSAVEHAVKENGFAVRQATVRALP